MCWLALPRTRTARVLLAFALLLVGAARTAAQPKESGAGTERLTQQLTALSARVSPDEANRLALHAHLASKELARRYRPVRPAQFHNFLINIRLKQRGLCHHWARDMGAQLAALQLRTLVLRWGIARRGTLREHNAVVVTARGQPFERGIVLDAWRQSGRLFSTPVATDKYPWQEDRRETFALPRLGQPNPRAIPRAAVRNNGRHASAPSTN